MKSDWKISFYKPDMPGTFPVENGMRFAAELYGDEECGVVLYEPDGRWWKVPFSSAGKSGALYGVEIRGEGLLDCSYNFYQKDRLITDPYAREILGLEVWADHKSLPHSLKGVLKTEDFDWEDDAPLKIPYSDAVLYGLDVRAFTMHKSSGVKHRGTYEGIVEKIPYFKELGITTLELMPCYEYEECMQTLMEKETRINCWGFQQGYYFAPKSSYSAKNRPVHSFKSMVKALHQNGIEVMMHFYFPPEVKQLTMLEVVRYWVREYHIDGVRLSGFHLPIRMLGEDAFLKETKIRCQYMEQEEYAVAEDTVYRNFALNNGNFRNDIRRFLKGDEGLVGETLHLLRNNPKGTGVVNYLADYDGFSLYDCVSYERKHNEENGEDNRDGEDANYTWNCGIEGESRKKGIQELRLKQLKNAIAFLFLAQGTPFLFSGDEFANTRFGNNNAYGQDNEIGWVKWKDNRFSRELLEFTRFMIAFRKKNPILHTKEPLKIMDSKGCGYPDISYHGTEAWRPDLSHISRMVGIMLCGQYAKEQAPFLYIACNMHWEEHKLALPKLPKGCVWQKILKTSRHSLTEQVILEEEADDFLIDAEDRTIALYQSVAKKKKRVEKRG